MYKIGQTVSAIFDDYPLEVVGVVQEINWTSQTMKIQFDELDDHFYFDPKTGKAGNRVTTFAEIIRGHEGV